MTTMQFEYDPEKLIEEVKKRPGIWDYESLDYRLKHVKKALWSEIVKELNTGTSQATKSEMRELELQLQKKWKSIRDCYQKYLVNPAKSKRPYIYANQLSFLVMRKGERRPPENYSSDSDDNKTKWVVRKRSRISRNDSDDEPEHLQVSNNTGDLQSEDEAVNTTNNTNDNFVPNQFAFANVDSIGRTDENDCDRLFLLSLLPHLKRVPEQNRLNVQMELMAVLRNAQYSRDFKSIHH